MRYQSILFSLAFGTAALLPSHNSYAGQYFPGTQCMLTNNGTVTTTFFAGVSLKNTSGSTNWAVCPVPMTSTGSPVTVVLYVDSAGEPVNTCVLCYQSSGVGSISTCIYPPSYSFENGTGEGYAQWPNITSSGYYVSVVCPINNNGTVYGLSVY